MKRSAALPAKPVAILAPMSSIASFDAPPPPMKLAAAAEAQRLGLAAEGGGQRTDAVAAGLGGFVAAAVGCTVVVVVAAAVGCTVVVVVD